MDSWCRQSDVGLCAFVGCGLRDHPYGGRDDSAGFSTKADDALLFDAQLEVAFDEDGDLFVFASRILLGDADSIPRAWLKL